MTYEIRFTTQFKKDLKLAKKQHKNLDELFDVINDLSRDMPLAQKYQDHSLSGNYMAYRECHISSDWLLIYRKESSVRVLVLYRVGSHAELF